MPYCAIGPRSSLTRTPSGQVEFTTSRLKETRNVIHRNPPAKLRRSRRLFRPPLISSGCARSIPDVYDLTVKETRRQVDLVRLIPSENYTSAAVLQAMATVFCNKYSEGYPGKRYYEGNELVDEIEELARSRAKTAVRRRPCQCSALQRLAGQSCHLFRADEARREGDGDAPRRAAGTSPTATRSTSAASTTSPRPTATMWSRGSRAWTRRPACSITMSCCGSRSRRRPQVIFAGGTAYPRIWDFARFRAIADEVDAYLVADIAHINGLIIGKVHPDPVPYADVVTSTKPQGDPRPARRFYPLQGPSDEGRARAAAARSDR